MAKIIRPRYSRELSIGLLFLIFALSFFLSGGIFESTSHNLNDSKSIYLGMSLLSLAVILTILILWEEMLFPVRIKPEQNGMVFRNHRTKLKQQVFLYCVIPVILGFVYYEYDVNFRYFIWAGACIILPVIGKLRTGVNNYNDFLKLTDDVIEYKNNKKMGTFAVKDVKQLALVKDERKVLHKINVLMSGSTEVTIDLDEMELEDFIESIDTFITDHYEKLVINTEAAA
ncbi:MAG TPA: heavy metal transporter [Chryseolinea sp.]|nr:heavy metal transporter [Chryseolinea sp.]HPH45983.1 heavy metal transporter [Chryseolinea sp.]HPM30669.1 heavy metal transporter [Chryseolinea sp.]